ncbi:hypothetical protein BT67DRAFT_495375 [Trichocladium antarcticum]|uniref:Uncharacterized protein n=1 Tax=Trichocladium antarcticum TaxID=1450529 RepID=A0AAN6ZEI8_9PEZI|nr:hypothetical protein BT67DRAFT_495375 [Trichocladium antarcticum]
MSTPGQSQVHLPLKTLDYASAGPSQQPTEPMPGLIPIWLCSASFPGNQLGAQPLTTTPVSASYMPQDEQDSIPFSTLGPLVPPTERERLCQAASSEPVYVHLSWRRTRGPSPVFQTRHLITLDTTGGNTTGGPTVVFAQDMAWTQTVVRNNEKSVKTREDAGRAVPRTQLPSSPTHRGRFCTAQPPASPRRRRRHRNPKPARALSPPGPDSIADPADGSGSGQAGQRRCCRRLIGALRVHAEAVYRETGDTAELLRVVRLSQRMVGFELSQTGRIGEGIDGGRGAPEV